MKFVMTSSRVDEDYLMKNSASPLPERFFRKMETYVASSEIEKVLAYDVTLYFHDVRVS